MRIFVAGPWGDYAKRGNLYELEQIEANINKADEVGQALVRAGHEVYVPHTMCRTWSGKFPRETMVRLDNSFLEHWAEAIYRIPGESVGSDAEVAHARELGLTVLVGPPQGNREG